MTIAGVQAEGKTRYDFDISLPYTPPTANARLHWRVKAKLSKEIRESVFMQALTARNTHRLLPVEERVSLRICLDRGMAGGRLMRMLDMDNLYAALKPVVDGLRDASWIRDDSPKWCDYTARQSQTRHEGIVAHIEVILPPIA